jgi:hypothetical protein
VFNKFASLNDENFNPEQRKTIPSNVISAKVMKSVLGKRPFLSETTINDKNLKAVADIQFD